MRRAALDLYPARPPFDGLNALFMPKRDLYIPFIRSLPEMSFRDYLNNMRRADSDLYPARPPFKGLNTLIMPKKDLYVSPRVYANEF